RLEWGVESQPHLQAGASLLVFQRSGTKLCGLQRNRPKAQRSVSGISDRPGSLRRGGSGQSGVAWRAALAPGESDRIRAGGGRSATALCGKRGVAARFEGAVAGGRVRRSSDDRAQEWLA